MSFTYFATVIQPILQVSNQLKNTIIAFDLEAAKASNGHSSIGLYFTNIVSTLKKVNGQKLVSNACILEGRMNEQRTGNVQMSRTLEVV